MKKRNKNKTPEDLIVLFGNKIVNVDDSDVFKSKEKINKIKNKNDEIR